MVVVAVEEEDDRGGEGGGIGNEPIVTRRFRTVAYSREPLQRRLPARAIRCPIGGQPSRSVSGELPLYRGHLSAGFASKSAERFSRFRDARSRALVGKEQ